MYDNTDAIESELRSQTLAGIWRYDRKLVNRESEHLYRFANVVVRGISEIVGGNSSAIPRMPRRSGNHQFEYHFAGDLANVLRYARSEADMAPDYLTEVVDAVAIVLGTRVIDIVDLSSFEIRTKTLPVPELEWGPIMDRPLGQIVLAARGRLAIEAAEPVPGQLATALTGWNLDRITKWQDPESGAKVKRKKRKNDTYFDPETLDNLVQFIERVYFDHNHYKPF